MFIRWCDLLSLSRRELKEAKPHQGHKGTVPVFIDRKQRYHFLIIFFLIINLKRCNQLNHLYCCLNWLLGKQRTLILLFSRLCLLLHVLCCAVLSRSIVYNTLQPHELQPTRLLCPWGFSRKGYWSGLPFPLPGDLPNPGIKPRSLVLQENSSPSEPPEKPLLSHSSGLLFTK